MIICGNNLYSNCNLHILNEVMFSLYICVSISLSISLKCWWYSALVVVMSSHLLLTSQSRFCLSTVNRSVTVQWLGTLSTLVKWSTVNNVKYFVNIDKYILSMLIRVLEFLCDIALNTLVTFNFKYNNIIVTQTIL